MRSRRPADDVPERGALVVGGEVPEGVVPPSTSMHPPPPSVLQGSPSAWSNDLRDRIAVSLDAHYPVGDAGNECSCNDWNPATTEWHTHQAAVVMAVVEPVVERARAGCCADGDATFTQMQTHLQAEIDRLRGLLALAEAAAPATNALARRQRERAERAEADHAGALRRLDVAQQTIAVKDDAIREAEAAVQRVREAITPSPLGTGETLSFKIGGKVVTLVRTEAVHTALDQPKETTHGE